MGQKDQFWPKTAKFGPKKSNLKFFGHFLKDQKNSSYGKNQKKLRKRLEEMGKKEHFLPKRPNFGQKVENENFCPEFFSPFFKRPKN